MVLKLGVNFGCHYPHFHRLSVYGTEGTFENGLESAFFMRGRDQHAIKEIVQEAYPGTHKGDLLLSFVDSIVSGSPHELQPSEIFSGMAVCFALEKSMNSNKPERVEIF